MLGKVSPGFALVEVGSAGFFHHTHKTVICFVYKAHRRALDTGIGVDPRRHE